MQSYRDFMMDAYRLNPTEYLTATACRRNLMGDVCAVLRVHAFLEQWGLINYQADPDSRPSPMAVPSTAHFNITVKGPMGYTPLLAPPDSSVVAAAPANSIELTNTNSQTTTTTTTTTTTIQNTTALAPTFGAQPDEFTAELAASKAEPDMPKWRQEETLALLEGIEMHSNDWTKVAQHVRTRSREECVLQFIRLPIEDPFIEAEKATSGRFCSLKQSNSNDSGDDSVISILSYLVESVHPSVAAAAAKAAAEEWDRVKASEDKVECVAAATALAAVSVRARNSAEESRQVTAKLTARLVEAQTRRVDVKIRQLDALERALTEERRLLDVEREQLCIERLRWKAKQV